MGYTTRFKGSFNCSRQLTIDEAEYLRAFSSVRHMKRDNAIAAQLIAEGKLETNTLRAKVKLPLGTQGAYIIDVNSNLEPSKDKSILDCNHPPKEQPGLWCRWTITQDRQQVCWSGVEKFYDYTAWIEYLIKHFFAPWGIQLTGTIFWAGENDADMGHLAIHQNHVFTRKNNDIDTLPSLQAHLGICRYALEQYLSKILQNPSDLSQHEVLAIYEEEVAKLRHLCTKLRSTTTNSQT